MRRFLIGAIVVLLVIVGGLLLAPGLLNNEDSVASAQDATVAIQMQTLTTSIGSNGTIAPKNSIDLSFGTTGIVEEVLVRAGDTVTAGQVLARLDTTDLDYQIRNAEESLRSAQASLDDLNTPPTEEELTRAENDVLSAQNQLQSVELDELNAPLQLTQSCSSVASSESDLFDAQTAYDDYVRDGYGMDATFAPDPDSAESVAVTNAQTAYDNAVASCQVATNNNTYNTSRSSAEATLAEAQLALDSLLAGSTEQQLIEAETRVTQAEISLEQAQRALDDAVIVAPFDGVITAMNLLENTSASSNTAAISMMDVQTLVLDVEVDELDIAQVAVGMSVDVSVQALDDAVLPGEVTYISPVGDDSSGIVTYTVGITLLETQTSAVTQTGFNGGTIPQGTGNGPGFVNDPNIALILEALGGPQALFALNTADDPAATLADTLASVELTEEQQAALEALGGVDGLIDTFSGFGGGAGPNAGQLPNANGTTGQETAQQTDQNTTAPSGFSPPVGGNSQTTVTDSDISANVELRSVRVGMTADVEIIVEVLEDVLVVPSSAIRYEGRTPYLMIDDGSDAGTRVDITTGQSSNGFTIITGDVQEGSSVIVPELEAGTSSNTGFGGPGGGPGGFGGPLGGFGG